MTPAERKFSGVEGGLVRAQSLVRVLREAFGCSLDDVDNALGTASTSWFARLRRRSTRRPRSGPKRTSWL